MITIHGTEIHQYMIMIEIAKLLIFSCMRLIHYKAPNQFPVTHWIGTLVTKGKQQLRESY